MNIEQLEELIPFKCPSCGEDVYIDHEDAVDLIADYMKNGAIVIDCYHCTASFSVVNGETELMFSCRHCQDGEAIMDEDRFSPVSGHYNVAGKCDYCERAEWREFDNE